MQLLGKIARLLKMLDELEIMYIDMLPIFRDAASHNQQLYFEVDGHWNASGHRLAAEAILDFLNAKMVIFAHHLIGN